MASETTAQAFGIFFTKVEEGRTSPLCFAPAIAAYEKKEGIDLNPSCDLASAMAAIQGGLKSLVVITIYAKEDVTSVLNCLIQVKKEIRQRTAIVIVFMRNANPKVEELLTKHGCSETLKFDVPEKAFNYKISRFLKILEKANQAVAIDDVEIRDGAKKRDKETSLEFQKESSGSQSKREAPFKIIMDPPVSSTWDFWLFRKKLYAKRVNGLWYVEMIGPSPSAGRFERVKNEANSAEDLPVWIWRPRVGTGIFSPVSGSWYFTGREPYYSWVINRWAFIGEFPELTYKEGDSILAVRLKTVDPLTLTVAKNSDYAISIFNEIKDTYDQDYHLSPEQLKFKELSLAKTDPGAEIPWADHINSKDISAADWNQGDLSTEERDWNLLDQSEDFATGAEAMEECALQGFLKTFEVGILGYQIERSEVFIGIPSYSVELQEQIEVIVSTENLGLTDDLKLAGTVTLVEDTELGDQQRIKLSLRADAIIDFKRMLRAVEQRQADILRFFKQAKGIE